MNKFVKENEEIDIPILKISKKVEEEQVNKLKKIKKKRDESVVNDKLLKIKKAAQTKENLVPLIIEAALDYATLGEIVEAMKSEFGEWQEKSVI